MPTRPCEAPNARPALVSRVDTCLVRLKGYVAASDLIPEVNRESKLGMAVMVFAGVAVMLGLKTSTASQPCGHEIQMLTRLVTFQDPASNRSNRSSPLPHSPPHTLSR